MKNIKKRILFIFAFAFLGVLIFGGTQLFSRDNFVSLNSRSSVQESIYNNPVKEATDSNHNASKNIAGTSVYSYSITYENIEDAILGTYSPTSYVGGEETVVSNPARGGYVFSGWSVNGSTELHLDYVIGTSETGNITLMANWEGKDYSYVITKESVGYSLTGGILSLGDTYDLSPLDESGNVVMSDITIQNYINAIDRDRITGGIEGSYVYDPCLIEFLSFTESTTVSNNIVLNNGFYEITGELWFVNYAGMIIGENSTVVINANLYDKQIDGTRTIISNSGSLTIEGNSVIGTGINYITSKIVLNGGSLIIDGSPTVISKIVLTSTDSYINIGDEFYPTNIAKNQGTSYAGKLNIFYDTSTFRAGTTYTRLIRNYTNASKVQAFVLSGNALVSKFTLNSSVSTDLDFDIAYKYVFYSDEGETGVARTEANVYGGQVIELPEIGIVSKEGFYLLGWFLNTNYSATQINGITTTASGITAIVRVNPLWIANQYTITYNNMDGAEHEIGYPLRYAYTESKTLKTASKEGYAFCGWYLSNGSTNGEWGEIITVLSAQEYTANIDLYAKWASQVISTDITDEGVVDGNVSSENGFDVGTSLIISEESSSEGIISAPNGYSIEQIYSLSLLASTNEVVDVSNTVSLTVKLPDGIEQDTLKVLVYENGSVTERDYTISGGYVTFTISELGDFAFATQKSTNLGWFALLFLFIIGVSTGAFYYLCNIKISKTEVQILIPLNNIPVANFNTLAQRVGRLKYFVVYENNVWVVRRDKTRKQYVISNDKSIAIKYARQYSLREQAELEIYDKDRRLESSINYESDKK